MITEHTTTFRVRYSECDQQGIVHHSRYLIYFEQGRIEMLRAGGYDYRKLEEEGIFVVVAQMEVRYRRPARYDDELRLVTRIARVSHAKIEHEYELYHGEELVVTGRSRLAVISHDGRVLPIPATLGGPSEDQGSA